MNKRAEITKKLSKLLMIDLSGLVLTETEREFLTNYPVGGVCLFGRNIATNEQVIALIESIKALTGDDTVIAVDQEGGSVLRLYDIPYPPSAMSLAAANDVTMTQQVAQISARGLKALGINVNFGPVADINNNPLNPIVVDRAFGSSTELAVGHVVAYCQGMQAQGIAATVKHFPGHGDVTTDSHVDLATLTCSRERLDSLELVPFKAAIAADVAAMMTFHGVVKCIDDTMPATLSRKVLTDLLRNELGFDGVVFTDALDMGAMAKYYRPEQSALLAVQAGADMPLHIGPIAEHQTIIETYIAAYNDGQLDADEVDDKLRRIQSLTRKYPIAANINNAKSAEDAELLHKAAWQGMCAINGFAEPLDKNKPVLLIAPQSYHVSIASMLPSNPIAELSQALQTHGFTVSEHLYDAKRLSQTELLAAANNEQVLFVTVNTHRLSELEVQCVTALQAQQTIVHLGLWNPYHHLDFTCPSLLTFNPETFAVQAAAKALSEGYRLQNTLPV